MDRIDFQQISLAIEKNNNIGILVGRDYDMDSLAAALSLYLALKSYGKKVSIASPKQATVEVSSLVGIDELKTNIETEGGDLTVSFPYKEGEIDKVSYTIDNGYLNIVVKTGEAGLSFDKNDIKYVRLGSYPKLIFVVGTPRLSDLNNLFDPEALKDATLINIDNKSDNQGFGEISLVSTQFSSVSEQIAKLIMDLNLNLDQDIAQNLLSGISYSTNNFQKQNTSIYAFEMAGILMRKGALRHDYQRQDKAPMPRQFFAPTPLTQQNQNRQDGQSRILRQGIQPQKPRDVSDKRGATPPPDWLMPKVYKGSSTNIS